MQAVLFRERRYDETLPDEVSARSSYEFRMSASSRDCLLCFTCTTHSSFAKIVFTSEKIEVEVSNSTVLVYISTA